MCGIFGILLFIIMSHKYKLILVNCLSHFQMVFEVELISSSLWCRQTVTRHVN